MCERVDDHEKSSPVHVMSVLVDFVPPRRWRPQKYQGGSKAAFIIALYYCTNRQLHGAAAGIEQLPTTSTIAGYPDFPSHC